MLFLSPDPDEFQLLLEWAKRHLYASSIAAILFLFWIYRTGIIQSYFGIQTELRKGSAALALQRARERDEALANCRRYKREAEDLTTKLEIQESFNEKNKITIRLFKNVCRDNHVDFSEIEREVRKIMDDGEL
jgi:hypothetical protein